MRVSDVQNRVSDGNPPASCGRRFLAVVPAYNEASSIAAVVRSLRADAPSFDVLVIDDGSTDRTAELAAAAGAPVVSLPFNLGIGGAVQTAFIFALENGYDYMAQVDGDGQHDAAELVKLIEVMDSDPSVDVACGSRFLPSEHDYRAPLGRRTGIHFFAAVLTVILRQKITDPTSGFRLYNGRAISLFARDYPHDYPEVEAVLMVHTNHLRMREVAVRMHGRTGGRSSINRMRSGYYMIKVSLALLAALLRRRPVVDSGDPAAVSTQR